MAFPTSPTNGQTTTVNGITYVYNSSRNAWKRQTLVDLELTGNVTANYFLGNGALLTGIVSGGGGGSGYGNTEVTANLTTGFYGNIIPSANLTYDIGSTTAWWGTFYGVSTQAKYADLAENYQADADYTPGTVLVFGGQCEVTTTTVTHDTSVAGVVSTNPAYLMNATTGNISVALTGRVPCQVRGPVSKGTVLVTSDVLGVAEAVDNSLYKPGCVLGKSLENIDDDSIKLIEVVVGRF
jgi:hypothetical protein